MKFRYVTSASALAVALSALFVGSAVRADSFESFDGLTNTDYLYMGGISSSGTTAFGESIANGSLSSEAFYWNATSGIVGLGHLGGDAFSAALGASADGSVIVGYSGPDLYDRYFQTDGQAFRWTAGGGMVALGTLAGGTFSVASGISGNSLVIVGQSSSTAYSDGEAFRWTSGGGMVGLGVLPGSQRSAATATNYDGSVIVGYGVHGVVMGGIGTIYLNTAFRWTDADGLIDIGAGSGFDISVANDLSDDGTVIVGVAQTGLATPSEAFRWTEETGIVALGSLGEGFFGSSATAVSADGSIVVGASSTDADPITGEAFIWTEQDGMRRVLDALNAGGVETGDMLLSRAMGISDDGSVIVGELVDGAARDGWIAVCDSALCTGLVTLSDTAASFSGVGLVGQTGNAYVGGQLGSFGEMATQHKSGGAPVNVFGSGFYDSDPVAAASVGATVDLDGGIVIGGSLGQSLVETPMIYDGESRIWGTSLGGFVSSNPDAGLQWVLAASASYFKGSIDRQYLNGVAVAQSSGDVKGAGYGALARLGYSFAANDHIRLTPFASYTVSKAHIDGYTEHDGPVPASFNDIDDTAQTLRLGSDMRFSFTQDTWTWGTLAWAHRLDDAKTAPVTGVLVSALPLTTPGVEVAENWLEATAGLRLPLSDNASLLTSVTAVVPDGYSTTYQARIGVSYAF